MERRSVRKDSRTLQMKLCRVLLTAAMFSLSAGVYAQTFAPTRYPHQGPQYVESDPMTQNWLYSGSSTLTGDYTGANVVFFSVPDTTTQTLYFAIRNPDVDVDGTLANSQPDLPVSGYGMTYTLIGGYRCLFGRGGAAPRLYQRKQRRNGPRLESRRQLHGAVSRGYLGLLQRSLPRTGGAHWKQVLLPPHGSDSQLRHPDRALERIRLQLRRHLYPDIRRRFDFGNVGLLPFRAFRRGEPDDGHHRCLQLRRL